jgi:hypothetical protein
LGRGVIRAEPIDQGPHYETRDKDNHTDGNRGLKTGSSIVFDGTIVAIGLTAGGTGADWPTADTTVTVATPVTGVTGAGVVELRRGGPRETGGTVLRSSTTAQFDGTVARGGDGGAGRTRVGGHATKRMTLQMAQ